MLYKHPVGIFYMSPDQIKELRGRLQMSQQAFAAALGVSFATVNRWENGKATPQADRIQRMRMLLAQSASASVPVLQASPIAVPRLDFEGDAEGIKLVVDA